MIGQVKAGAAKANPAGRLAIALLCGTMLTGLPTVASAQEAEAGEAGETAVQQPVDNTIRTISIVGAERLEAQTILSYIKLRVGQQYTSAAADGAASAMNAAVPACRTGSGRTTPNADADDAAERRRIRVDVFMAWCVRIPYIACL